MVCASCGRALDRPMAFCPMCGRRQSEVLAATRDAAVHLAETIPSRGSLLGAINRSEAYLDWRTALAILIALCEEVTATRARGAVQLVLEPDLFYVETDDAGRWRATLLDAEAQLPREARDTEKRHVPPWVGVDGFAGAYWSPARLRGQPLDPANDVYTLGTIAYELVAGQTAFDRARGVGEIVSAHLHHLPNAPSAAHPELRIPLACDVLLLRCLDKNPEHRYRDAAELADAAAMVLASEPTVPLPRVARPIRPPSIKRPTARRQPVRSRAKPPVPRVPLARVYNASPCGSTTCKVGHRLYGGANATLVGAWLYADHFDSSVSGRPDASPHPHAGVATVSYLFDGRLLHRDSLGHSQLIERGALSWFVAGRGAVHAERQQPIDRMRGAPLHGLELWAALPRPNEDDAPAYAYHRASTLPSVVIGGVRVRVRVILGDGFGATSPAELPAPLSLFDVRLPAHAAVPLPAPNHHDYQRGIYVVSGAVELAGRTVTARQLAVLRPGAAIGVRAAHGQPAHIIGLGSAPVLGPRHSWWYFSSSSQARIAEARRRWAANELGHVPGETERAQMPTPPA